jgi:hypothetical protein
MTLAAMAEVLELEAMLDKAGVPRREGVKIDPSKFVPANPQLPPIRIDDEPPTKPTGDPANPPKSPDELETTQSTVLNGAQVSAATAIVVAVAAGEIPRDAGLGQLEVLFNLKPEQAERIMGSAGKGTPTTPNTNPLHDLEPSPVIEPQQQPMTAALLSILQRSNNRLRKLSAVQAN